MEPEPENDPGPRVSARVYARACATRPGTSGVRFVEIVAAVGGHHPARAATIRRTADPQYLA